MTEPELTPDQQQHQRQRFACRFDLFTTFIHEMGEPQRTEAYLEIYEWAHNAYYGSLPGSADAADRLHAEQTKGGS